MKANLKGLGGIKSLLLAHGEKLGIAVVGACASMLVYYSLLRDHLPDNRQAADLEKEISLAKSEVASFDWPKAVTEFPGDVRIAKPLEQKGDNMVRVETYQTDTWQREWDPPVVPPTVLRTDPVLLEVQDVEAHGGSGLLAFVDPEVRRRKIIEEQTKLAQREKEQKKELEKQQQEQERGGGARTRGRGGIGGSERDGYGGGVYDPEHPKRRAVVGTVRPAGVPLQDYEEVKVAHWAIVVAKVPIKEQIKLFRDAFDNARGSNQAADFPQYLGYYVQRAEIRPGEEDKSLTWERVSVYNGKSTVPIDAGVTTAVLYGTPEDPTAGKKAKAGVVTDWVSEMPEVADPRYLEGGALAFPLPPLVGRDWGAEASHSEIPLAIDAVPEEEAATPEAAKPDAEADAEPGDLFSAGTAPGMGADRRQLGYGGGGRGGFGDTEGRMRGMGGGRGYGGYEGDMGGDFGGGRGRGGYGEEGYGGGGYGAAGRGGMSAGGTPQMPHWLLRFFDFSVQPGKKYKYRVQLAMLDPNQSYGTRLVGTDALDSEAIARIKKEKATRKPGSTPVRFTEWSKPSRTVSIPLAGIVRVASAKPATEGINKEPSTTLLVESFGDDKGKAIEAAKEMDFKRGSVANMTADTEVLADQGRAIDPFKAFKFQTDITVVDVRGGERLVRDDKRPACVLLMDPAGQLFVQNELDDSDAVELHRTTFAKEPVGGAGGEFYRGGGEDYGGRGNYGGFEGGRGGR